MSWFKVCFIFVFMCTKKILMIPKSFERTLCGLMRQNANFLLHVA